MQPSKAQDPVAAWHPDIFDASAFASADDDIDDGIGNFR